MGRLTVGILIAITLLVAACNVEGRLSPRPRKLCYKCNCYTPYPLCCDNCPVGPVFPYCSKCWCRTVWPHCCRVCPIYKKRY